MTLRSGSIPRVDLATARESSAGEQQEEMSEPVREDDRMESGKGLDMLFGCAKV